MTAAIITDSQNSRTGRERSRDAFERSVAVFRSFRHASTAEEMERIATRLEQAVARKTDSRERDGFLAALSGGSLLDDKERVELEVETVARFFERRQQLLQDALSAGEVARLLGTSRQTPHDRVKSGTLLAVRERGGLRFPSWQFDSEGPDGVVAGFPNVLKALDVSPLAKVSWFTLPNPYLEGRTPLQALKSGEVERLISIARSVGVS